MGRKAKSITQRQLEVVSARVNYEIYKRLETLAHKEDLSITHILRKAVNEYLDRHKAA